MDEDQLLFLNVALFFYRDSGQWCKHFEWLGMVHGKSWEEVKDMVMLIHARHYFGVNVSNHFSLYDDDLWCNISVLIEFDLLVIEFQHLTCIYDALLCNCNV